MKIDIRIICNGFCSLFFASSQKRKVTRLVSHSGNTILFNFISSVIQNDFHIAQQLMCKDK